jgi:putative ABC transport system permease protein
MRWLFPLAWWDKLSRTATLAVRSLWLHKLRSVLSVLGIIIGTAAVISLMAFGEGSMQDALEDIKRQGATSIIIKSVKPTEVIGSSNKMMLNYGLTYQDEDILSDSRINKMVVRAVPMRIFPFDVRYLDRSTKARVVGTTKLYAEVSQFTMAAGRFLVDEDARNTENVAVLGAGLAEVLFPFENPIGKIVLANNKMPFSVVGVVSERKPAGSGAGKVAEEFNLDMYIPLRTNEARIGGKVMIRAAGTRSGEEVELHQITLTVDKMENVRDCGQLVKDFLTRVHKKNDWEVTIPLDRLEEAERQRDRFTMLLAWIGSISLFVGGIGIMNIMLATVTERTREIGVRRALGAKRRDITVQFLIEAVVQTTMGGLIGLMLGLIIVFGAPMVNLGPAKLNVMWTFMAIIASVLVGVLFGWYPAWRASKLDPIEALRHV